MNVLNVGTPVVTKDITDYVTRGVASFKTYFCSRPIDAVERALELNPKFVVADDSIDPGSLFHLIQDFKNHSKLHHIEWIILLDPNDDPLVELLKEAEVETFVYKPFSSSDLLKTLETLLSKKSSSSKKLIFEMRRNFLVKNYRDAEKIAFHLIAECENLTQLEKEILASYFLEKNDFNRVNEVVSKSENTPRILEVQGRVLFKRGKIEDAKKTIELANLRSPINPDRIKFLIKIELDRIETKLQKLRILDKEDKDAIFQLAKLSFIQGKWTESVKFFELLNDPESIKFRNAILNFSGLKRAS